MTTLVDSIRAYWDAQPCNIKHSAADIGTPEFFRQVASRRYRVEPHIIGFMQPWRWKNRRVLEIGCGIGTDGAVFSRAGADYEGIDASQRSVDICAMNGLEAWRMDAESVYVKGSWSHGFDLVYSFGVLHHIPDVELVLSRIPLLLAPGGEFRCMVYNTWSWKRFVLLFKGGLAASEAQAGCPYTRTYTTREVRKLLAGYGLKVVSVRNDFIFPYKVDKYINHEYVRPWYMALLQPFKRWIGWHKLVVAVAA